MITAPLRRELTHESIETHDWKLLLQSEEQPKKLLVIEDYDDDWQPEIRPVFTFLKPGRI